MSFSPYFSSRLICIPLWNTPTQILMALVMRIRIFFNLPAYPVRVFPL